MMPEVRTISTLSVRVVFIPILYRFHQGYIPTRTCSVDLASPHPFNVSCRVFPSCRSVGERSIMGPVTAAAICSSAQKC